MGTNRDSDSIHGSDASATAINPNSSKNTPTKLEFPPDATSRDIQSIQNGKDTRNIPQAPVPGWPNVAERMAETADFTSFARFRDINVKSLLYYQAQLTKLRMQLHELEWIDNRSGGDANQFAESVDTLIDSAEEKDHEQWKLIEKTRKVLKEYNKALLLFSQVSALPEPESCNMKTFRMWLRNQDFDIMGRGEEHTWGNLYRMENPGSLKRRFVKLLWSLIWPKSSSSSDDLDLVAIRPSRNVDGFTLWVAGDFLPYYNDFCEYMKKKLAGDEEAVAPAPQPEKQKPQEEEPVATDSGPKPNTLSTYSESSMLKFTSSVSTVVACLLPTVAIIVLAQVQGMRNLLLCLAGFAVIFSTGLIFLTSGTTTRVEIFTATAAFSAVLVVFISTPVVIVQG